MKYEYIEEAGGIYIPVPECYKDCIELVKSDLYRLYGTKVSFYRIIIGLRNLATAFPFWLRMSAWKGWAYPICKRVLDKYTLKHGLEIPPTTKIGYGLYLGHRFGIIINATAIIGNNVNLSQFTTIGSNKDKAAIIGDEVYIGPGVSIVEDIVIHKNAVVGAGATVVKDVPENVSVGGCPAKVISSNSSARFIRNKYPINRGV